MPRWACPNCRRELGRHRQPHECSPALIFREYFATAAAFERPIFDALTASLEELGPVHVEPLSVGIFIKSSRSLSAFAALLARALDVGGADPARGGALTNKGTKPGLARPLLPPSDCGGCHGNFAGASNHEPFPTWPRGRGRPRPRWGAPPGLSRARAPSKTGRARR
jgi:hypothetical protein